MPRLVLSGLSLGLIALRWYKPGLVVDSTTVALLVAAMIPWIGSFVDSLDIPGLGKIKLRDLEEAQRQVEGAFGADQALGGEVEPLRAREDRLAVAELTLRLDEVLNHRADKVPRPDSDRQGLVDRLIRDGSGAAADPWTSLQMLRDDLSRVVVASKVDPRVARWVRAEGPRILARVDASSAKDTAGPGR